MNILSKIPGVRRFNEELAPTCPGGWIARDPLTGNLSANLMLLLDMSAFDPSAFGHMPQMLGPGIEVRAGVLARRAFASDLNGWVESQETYALEQVARESAEHLAGAGLRQVRQYLWLVAALPARATPESMRGRLGVLEGHAESLCAHLRMRARPADDCRDVAKTYEPRKDPSGGLPPTACSFFPVYPDWTGYLQGERSLDHARAVVPELVRVAHTSFTAWVTAEWLSRDASRRVRRAAEAGFLRCKYQLTLHHCDTSRRQHVQAAMRRHGLVFSEEAEGFLGWRAARKTFWKPMSELAACCPLLKLPDSRVDHAGLLLRTEAGTPVVFDPFSSDTNYNVMVTGGQSTGKEYLCRSLLSAHVAAGNPAWLIARDNSSASTTAMVDMLGGRSHVLELAGAGLNPLAMCQDDYDVDLLRNWVASLIAPAFGQLHEAALMRLQNAMVMAWKYRNGPLSLEMVRQELEREDDELCAELGRALAPYTRDGEYARLFSGEPVDLSTDSLLVLDTTEFTKKNGPMVTITLLAMLTIHWEHLQPRQRKMVCFRASDIALQDDYKLMRTGALIEAMMRRARMRNGAIVTCLSYHALESGSLITHAIAENSAWHALMQAPRYADDWDDLTKALGYSERIAHLWPRARTVAQREATFVLVSGSDAQLLSLNPGQLHQGMHAPDDLTGPAYRAARLHGLSPVDALRAATARGGGLSE